MFNKKSLIAVAVASGLFLSAFPASAQKTKEPETLKIGAILPLTGNAAVVGVLFHNGIDIAVDQINKAGGIKGRKVEVLYGDSKGDPKEGLTIAQKFISVDKLPVIISALSSVTMAIIPVVDKAKTVLVCGLTLPKVTELSPYVFRYFLRMDAESEKMSAFAYNKLKIKSVVILYENDEAGLRGQEAFQKVFKKHGGKVLAAESYEMGKEDMRSQLLKIKNLKPDAFYVIGFEKTMGVAVKQLREIGVKETILAGSGLATGSVSAVAGEAMEGAYYTVPALATETKNPIVKTFADTYRANYKSEPVAWSGYYYGIMKMIAKAIETQGYNAEGIRKGLTKIKDLPGVCGNITVLPNRDTDVLMGIVTIKEGKPVVVE